MKPRKSVYWISTALVAAVFAAGGAADLAATADMRASMAHLGYPEHLLVLLGTWKVLAAIALLAPRFPRLKEWAYAGIAFDLTGAAFAHFSVGDGADKFMIPLALLGLAAVSWALRPASRVLGTIALPATATAAPQGQPTVA